jgi:hypothetical protein
MAIGTASHTGLTSSDLANRQRARLDQLGLPAFWVGLGIIADNLISMGRVKSTAPSPPLWRDPRFPFDPVLASES